MFIESRRRPIALKSGGIGVWDNVLQLMTLIAVITNCALIGVTSTRWWPDDVSPATQILVVVIAEHVILFLKVGGLDNWNVSGTLLSTKLHTNVSIYFFLIKLHTKSSCFP